MEINPTSIFFIISFQKNIFSIKSNIHINPSKSIEIIEEDLILIK